MGRALVLQRGPHISTLAKGQQGHPPACKAKHFRGRLSDRYPASALLPPDLPPLRGVSLQVSDLALELMRFSSADSSSGSVITWVALRQCDSYADLTVTTEHGVMAVPFSLFLELWLISQCRGI
ncbi:unnamed protein product [Leuciscus chuanchicus]